MAFTHARADVTASWLSAADVPVTAAGYTATGSSVDLSLHFAPQTGTNLTIVNNTGLAFIEGTFSNLAQGQSVALTFGGRTYDFVANYYGGTGNDLVLQWKNVAVMGWGYNFNGQLGNHSLTDSPVAVAAITTTGVLAGKTITSVAVGGSYSLALCADGTLAAWGLNVYGELGYGGTDFRSSVPVAVLTSGVLAGKTVVAMAAGLSHSLALCSDGTVAAWGANYDGQLGDNNADATTNIKHPAPVAVFTGGVLAGKKVIAIAAGLGHSLALCSDGTLVGWGKNSHGELGNAPTLHSAVPVAVSTAGGLAGKSVTAIAAGNGCSLALCSDGTVAAWGDNTKGQLGRSGADSSVPVAITGGALAGRTVVAASVRRNHTLALCSDGTLAAWGDNTYGQLGNGSTTSSPVPVPVAVSFTGALSGKTVTAVSAGNDFSCVLCPDGTMACWGNNGGGALGDDSTSTSPSLVPVAVRTPFPPTDVRFVALSPHSSSIHTLAIVVMEDRRISVTGNNVAILPGSAAPSLADGTDFGLAKLPGTQVTRTFSIADTGAASLSLTSPQPVILTGDGAPDFEVNVQPAAFIAPGGSTSFTITFDPRLPGRRTATVNIATNDASTPSFTFEISGIGAPLVKLAQTITFAPPATLYSGQSPFTLRATASSGLPVTLSLTSGNASLAGHVLTCPNAGIVKVSATVPANERYNAAPTITRTITIKADPATLTLINLTQTYDGLPKPVATLGSADTPTITYKAGTVYVPIAPTAPGSYAVKAVAGTKTVTGTLIIAKAPLHITADDKHRFVQQPYQELTVSYSGFVNDETAAVLTKAPVLTTTATSASAAGLYPITASGAVAANYTLIYHQGTLVVDGFAGNYEMLLVDADQIPVGKLTITMPATGWKFTAKLTTADLTAPAFAGTFYVIGIRPPYNSGSVYTNAMAQGNATTNVTLNKVVTPFSLVFSLTSFGEAIALLKRGDVTFGTCDNGQRLSTNPVLFAGAHTAVFEPATPAASNVPTGAGWATVKAGTTGILTFAGKLGDGTAFTTTLSPDRLGDPGYRLFVQPYVTARAQSFLAGTFTFAPHPTLTNRRYLAQQSMTWKKTGLAADASYRSGFGPVSTVLMIDPWLPPAAATKTVPAVSLAQRLGLAVPGTTLGVTHSATGSASQASLPARLGLSAANAVSVLAPVTTPANKTKWKTLIFVPTTGTFTGSFELVDGTLKRPVTFSGVLRQPANNADPLIGDGQYLLPPISGMEKSTGEILFTRP